jgi:hypothetical protein
MRVAIIAAAISLSACAELSTAPDMQVQGQSTLSVLDTTATTHCWGGSQQYVPAPKPQPKNPAACPIFQSLTCKP